MSINNGEILYEGIQNTGKIRINRIVDIIIRELEPRVGKLNFPSNIKSINKIYVLIENGYYPYMEEILKKHGYDLKVELQFLLVNLTNGTINSVDKLMKFPSSLSINLVDNQYIFNTTVGLINITPLHIYMGDKKVQSFALHNDCRGGCHLATLEFIKRYRSYKGITSLVPNQFGERQYHSYVEIGDGYADFANNAYLQREDFEKIMIPETLSEVYGYELEDKINLLDEHDLPKSKTGLVRIAVHEQLKRTRK
jgi:hypothetical protein